MGFTPCNRGEKLDRNSSLEYLVVGWALRPCDRENFDSNFRLGYLLVRWALRPCGRRENLNRKCRVV